MFRLLPSIFTLCVVTLMFVVSPALGQLTNVQWNESLNLDAVPDENDNQVGISSSTPEPLSGSLSGPGYSLSGSVSFASPGAPNATSQVSGSYSSGLQFLGGSAYCRIDFQFGVVMTSTPPVVVVDVPVDVEIQGRVEVSGNGDIFANAFSSVNFGTTVGPLGAWSAVVANSSGPDTASFDERDLRFLVAQASVVFGDMTASASISAEVLVPDSGTFAFAWVDPVIEVADELIPGGGGATYRDHFEIEFADGYWALGQAPNRNTTWGRIKQLYR